MKLTLTAFVALCIACTQGIKTSCHVRPKGNTAEIICNFKKNIGNLKYDFVVDRHSLDKNDKKEEEIVSCNWISARLECVIQPTYSFDKQVSDMAFIEIPHLSKKYEGRFVCHVVGNNDDDDTFCEYRHTEIPGPEESTPSSPSSSPPKSDGTLQKDSVTTDLCFSAVIPLSALAILLLVATIVLAVVLWRTCEKRGPEPHSGHFEEIKEELEALRQQASTRHKQVVQKIYNESKDTQAVILRHFNTVQSASLPQTEERVVRYTNEPEDEIHDLGDDQTLHKSNNARATQPTDPLLV